MRTFLLSYHIYWLCIIRSFYAYLFIQRRGSKHCSRPVKCIGTDVQNAVWRNITGFSHRSYPTRCYQYYIIQQYSFSLRSGSRRTKKAGVNSAFFLLFLPFVTDYRLCSHAWNYWRICCIYVRSVVSWFVISLRKYTIIRPRKRYGNGVCTYSDPIKYKMTDCVFLYKYSRDIPCFFGWLTVLYYNILMRLLSHPDRFWSSGSAGEYGSPSAKRKQFSRGCAFGRHPPRRRMRCSDRVGT